MNNWTSKTQAQKTLAFAYYTNEEIKLAAHHMDHEELVRLSEQNRFAYVEMRALLIEVGAL